MQPVALCTGFRIKPVFFPFLLLFSMLSKAQMNVVSKDPCHTQVHCHEPFLNGGKSYAQSPAFFQTKVQSTEAHENCHLHESTLKPLLSLTKPFQGISHCLVFHHVNEPPSQAKMWEDQEYRFQDIIDVIQLLKKIYNKTESECHLWLRPKTYQGLKYGREEKFDSLGSS